MELCSIVSANSSDFKVKFGVDLIVVPLQSTKPLIFYIDSINHNKPYIVISKRYIVSFAFKANGSNKSYQICVDKFKRPYSLFLGCFIVLLSGFRLSARLIVFIANIVKFNAKFIQVVFKVTVVKVAKLVMLNKQTFIIFNYLED